MSNTVNQISKSLNLATVVMPLVRVMADASLSWAEREAISAAICEAHRQWKALEKEREAIRQVQAAGQQNAQNAGNAAIQMGLPPNYPID